MLQNKIRTLEFALSEKDAENKKLSKWCEHLERKLLGFVDLAFERLGGKVNRVELETGANGARRRQEA